MKRALLAWGTTIVLAVTATVAVMAVAVTGAPPVAVLGGALVWLYLTYLAYRSGGRFEFVARNARPLEPEDPPTISRALLEACERTGRPVPDPLVVELDAPGAMVGYDDGQPVVGIDPRLPVVIGQDGMIAVLAHELGHLGIDLYTDAIRKFCPQVIGFGTLWVVVLAGQGPLVAAVGTVIYLGLVLTDRRTAAWIRYAMSLGAEPAALAVSRFANRQEEYLADQFATRAVDPAVVTEALYRMAAVATGDNDEDVAGPVPWNADRSLRFSLFATHPTVENRAAALGCSLPEWVRPHQPHRTA